VHTWPEECFAAFDVFSCGDMDTARIVEVIREALHPIREDVRILHRGVDEDAGWTS
jgi:S-adenosylmethionine/arginine decarboxylase-like enzyme